MTIAESGLDALAPVDGLLVKLENGVLSVTIDRPDSLNSLTPKVLDGLADAFERAATDPRVRVVRLGGSGRGFSSGAGIGAEETGDRGDVWSHKWAIPGGVEVAPGLRASTYLTVPEDCRVGVCAHEWGHLAAR